MLSLELGLKSNSLLYCLYLLLRNASLRENTRVKKNDKRKDLLNFSYIQFALP